MIGQIIFTVIAFVLFIYTVLFKIIRKNDTTYLIPPFLIYYFFFA